MGWHCVGDVKSLGLEELGVDFVSLAGGLGLVYLFLQELKGFGDY